MSTINPLTRQMSAKIVYVGPGLSGKTTSLQYIHSRLSPERRGELVSLATDEDRTLFFDFLPVRVPRINGLGVRLHLYTVPGQVFYAATRNLVLNGADGIVFVADAQPARREANIQSLTSTREHLEDNGIDFDSFPVVFQYNKRDIEGTMSTEELRGDLNPLGRPEFDTIATEGTGILEALRHAVRAVIRSLNQEPSAPGLPRRDQAPASDTGIARRLAHLAEGGSNTLPAAPSPESETSGRRLAPRSSVGDPRSKGFDDLPLMPRGSAGARAARSVAEPVDDLDEIAFEPEGSNAAEQEHVTTERPVAGVSFSQLWDASQRAPIAVIESCITAARYHDAVHQVASALAALLHKLPVPNNTDMGARAHLLGLDGHEYLRVCRLASQPAETITGRDALFALYLLVGAQVKLQRLSH